VIRAAAQRLGLGAHDVATLARAGLLGPIRPDHGVRLAVDVLRWGPLAGAARAQGVRHGDRPALIDDGGTLSFRDLAARGEALARAWAADGLGQDDGIAILCRNHRGMIDASIAASMLGARALYLNTGFSRRQLHDVAEREGARALIHDEEFAALVGEAGEGRLHYVAEGVEDLIARGRGAPALRPPKENGTIVMLTSGTTGTPKGAPRRQPRSLSAVTPLLSKVPFRAKESTLIAAPLFHATGFAHFALALGLGSTAVVQRRFDPQRALEALAEHRCTALVVVPVMLQRMLALGDDAVRAHDTSALRIVFCAGSALSGELATRAMDAFGDVVYNLYGSTEVAQATIATPDELRAAPGTAGTPPRGTVVRLFDDDGRPIDRPGATGRIYVQNIMQFEGYSDGSTKDVIEGLMATGDVGHFDDAGRLFVDGRDDEMIVSGAENVFPQEVEEVLAEHPAVAEAACVGVPDEEFGQRLRAFVALRDGASAGEDELKHHVRENLARYKVPREVLFVDELPRNPTGKVLKRELAERRPPAR
jgi:acyl-CoA synthetase (AMP-forming)/AMP-acid ligase II